MKTGIALPGIDGKTERDAIVEFMMTGLKIAYADSTGDRAREVLRG